MALLQITLKNSANVNGIKLEKGMSVKIVSNSANPFSTLQEQRKIQDAFLQKYRIDLKKACRLASQYFEVKKMN